MDSRFQVQLEEDGDGSTGQSWMKTSRLWPQCSTGSDKAKVKSRSKSPRVNTSLGAIVDPHL